MKGKTKDKDVLKHIKDLVAEEERLYATGWMTKAEREELEKVKVELDQYWDLLRQRRALRDAGKNPDQAHLRPPGTVESYFQ